MCLYDKQTSENSTSGKIINLQRNYWRLLSCNKTSGNPLWKQPKWFNLRQNGSSTSCWVKIMAKFSSMLKIQVNTFKIVFWLNAVKRQQSLVGSLSTALNLMLLQSLWKIIRYDCNKVCMGLTFSKAPRPGCQPNCNYHKFCELDGLLEVKRLADVLRYRDYRDRYNIQGPCWEF